MKNINVIPTNKPSRLYYSGNNTDLLLSKELISFKTFERSPQDFYITSDEEIKEGDWFITNNNEIFKCIKNKEEQCFYSLNASILTKFCKKIILTTDTDLIQDDVQAIDDEFLEWFVNNPSCEEVEVREIEVEDYVGFAGHTSYPTFHKEYKIIIPKKEPKQEQEVCNRCGKTLREQMKGCGEITCYRQFLPKQEKLTYTESAKKEERISNCTMMKRKRETLEEDDQTLAEIKERMKTRELEKTAVEWLIDWMKANQYFIGNDLLEAAHTAKAMEYFQNKKMYERGAEDFVKKVNQLSKPSSNEK